MASRDDASSVCGFSPVQDRTFRTNEAAWNYKGEVMQGIYRCLWCSEVFLAEVPTAVVGSVLPQYHDPCPRRNELGLNIDPNTLSVKGAAVLLAIVKER